MEKQALFGWLQDRLNRRADAKIEHSLESPEASRELFDQIRQQQEGGPGFLARFNPLNWPQMAYMNRLGGTKHVTDRVSSRLQDDDTIARMFPNRTKSTGSALAKVMGPLGMGGAGAFAGGIATGSPLTALAGGGAMVAQGIRQHRRASDPMTWARAFGTPVKGEQQQASADHDFLSNAMSLMGDKQAAITLDIEEGDTLLFGRYKNSPHVVEEIGTDDKGQPTINGMKLLACRIEKKMPKEKTASIFSSGPVPFHPDSQQETNARANEFLDSHFALSRGRQSILDSTNVRPYDKLKLLNALDQGAKRENTGDRGLLTFRSALSSMVGAGMGYLGASLAAPILGTSDKQKSRLQIGSGALGAILNNPWITKAF